MAKSTFDKAFRKALKATKKARKSSKRRRVLYKPGRSKKRRGVHGMSKDVDFTDMEAVKALVAEDLGYEPEDLDISEAKNYDSFGTGTFYEVESGTKSWIVAQNADEAYDLATAVVEQDLEHEPEIFAQSFIEQHINIDQLRRDLQNDVESSLIDDLTEEAERDPVQFAKDHDLEDDIKPPTKTAIKKHVKEWDELEGQEAVDRIKEIEDMDPLEQWEELDEEPTIPHDKIEEIAEEEAKSRLKDPMDYLSDIYGKEDAVKQAIEIAGIDYKAAATDAVDTDGWEHFLARYDGESHELDGGIVYWRDN